MPAYRGCQRLVNLTAAIGILSQCGSMAMLTSAGGLNMKHRPGAVRRLRNELSLRIRRPAMQATPPPIGAGVPDV